MPQKQDEAQKYRIRLDLAYDGALFMGWQKQTGDTYTVQGVLEEKLSIIFNQPIKLQGSGRTDRGVHALQQTAHFDAPTDPSKMNLRRALQSLCPKFIVIKNVFLAPSDFHAQRSAIHKTYKYLIRNHSVPSAMKWNKSFWYPKNLNIEYLNELSSILIGTHDFKSFQNAGTELKTTVRTISHAHWEKKGAWVTFTICGSGFLKQMVRNIVGTLLTLQTQEGSVGKLQTIIASHDRRKALKTAAPEGLYLVSVQYPKEIDKKCLKL